jgi:hypothetical protein
MKKISALFLLFALACTSAAPRSVTVPVSIESQPSSGEVYVDGKFVGSTPMVAQLTPGAHPIEVRHQLRGAWQRELTVIPGSPTRVMALFP